MNRLLIAFALSATSLLGLSGCATDIMRGYLGQGPEAVMARYGPPDHVFDLPDGRRAYQWLEVSQTYSAGTAHSRTRQTRRHGRLEEVTTVESSPSTSEETRCFYTMYAHRDGERWLFDDFAKPKFGCF